MPASGSGPFRVALFNHKGGVGKTTLTVNIAHALSELGQTVLLVDSDPQCSLSSFYLEEAYLDRLLDGSEDPRKGRTIWSAVRPVSEGTGEINAILPTKLSNPSLFLLPGDIRLAAFEGELAYSWTRCLERDRRGYRGMSAISELVTAAANHCGASFIFYDLGPNIGPLNRAIVLDCTHLIVPAACDLFSLRALSTLGFSLAQWVATWRTARESAPDNTIMLEGRPKLLGYIPQGFKVYRGEMVARSVSVLAALESRIRRFVRDPLTKAYPGNQEHGNERQPLRLGEIKHFGTLASSAQIQGVPIWEVAGTTNSQKTAARRAFMQIAKRIVSHTA